MKNEFHKINTKLSVLLIVIVIIIVGFLRPKHSLTGTWSILNPDGTSVGEFIDFKKDNTYAITLPGGQIGERGMYQLKDSTFSIKNIKDACGKDYWGKYNLTFIGDDSVHFALIEDTCSERRMDIVGFNPGLKRYVKK